MAGRLPVVAREEQRHELLTLSQSRERGEADRARALLLTLAGWTSPRIAEAFGVREDTVRLWRSDFMRGGVAALRRSLAPGPAPIKAERALEVAEALLSAPVADEPLTEQPGPPRKRKAARKPVANARANMVEATPALSISTRQPRTGTKQELFIGMLRRPEGATVPEVVEVTRWLPHTVRGAIAGALKKKLGLTVTTEKIEERGRVYRITT